MDFALIGKAMGWNEDPTVVVQANSSADEALEEFCLRELPEDTPVQVIVLIVRGKQVNALGTALEVFHEIFDDVTETIVTSIVPWLVRRVENARVTMPELSDGMQEDI